MIRCCVWRDSVSICILFIITLSEMEENKLFSVPPLNFDLENVTDKVAATGKSSENDVSSRTCVQKQKIQTDSQQRQAVFEEFQNVGELDTDAKCKTTACVNFPHNVHASKMHLASSEDLVVKKNHLLVNKLNDRKMFAKSDKLRSMVVKLNDLPNETLEYIFSHLGIKDRIRTELVCKRWRMIGKSFPWSWPKTLSLGTVDGDELPPLTDEILSSILSRSGIGLKQFVLVAYYAEMRLTSRLTVIIGNYCPNLVVIELYGLSSVDSNKWYLKPLARGCPKLKHIVIENANLTDDCLSSLFCYTDSSSIPQYLKLESFTLKTLDWVTGECFGKVSHNLKVLYLDDCPCMKSELVFKNVLQRCGGIRELSLLYFGELHSEQLLQVLSHYEETLKVLRLDGNELQSVEWIENLSKLSKVEELSLCDCVGVNDQVMKAVAKNCAKMQILNVNACCISDTGVSYLALAPSLKALDISNVRLLRGKGIGRLAVQGRLEELSVRRICKTKNTVEKYCALFCKFCSNFRILDVSYTVNITNSLVKEFCSAIDKGFLRGPVKLYVGATLVRRDVEHLHEKLIVIYESASILWSIDSHHEEDNDGSGSSSEDNNDLGF